MQGARRGVGFRGHVVLRERRSGDAAARSLRHQQFRRISLHDGQLRGGMFAAERRGGFRRQCVGAQFAFVHADDPFRRLPHQQGHALHGPCAPFADAAAARGDDAAAVRLPHRHGSRGLREVQRPGAGGQGGLLCLPLEPQTLRSRGVRGREAHDARTSDRVLRR